MSWVAGVGPLCRPAGWRSFKQLFGETIPKDSLFFLVATRVMLGWLAPHTGQPKQSQVWRGGLPLARFRARGFVGRPTCRLTNSNLSADKFKFVNWQMHICRPTNSYSTPMKLPPAVAVPPVA